MNKPSQFFFSILFLILMLACKQETKPVNLTPEIKNPPAKQVSLKKYPEFDRSASIENIKNKIENNEALIVHALIPLCDNEHQGIVPVNQTLGNGFNPRTNLYWGALYGVKTHFKKQSSWKYLMSKDNPSEGVLERVVFYKEYANNAKVYLIADAYRGDKMKLCVEDFFDELAGYKNQEELINDIPIQLGSNTDLLIFNGHNGLMDFEYTMTKEPENEKVRDAAVIACASHSYFVDELKKVNGYPLLLTTNLLAPEAYVMEGIVDAWATQKTGPEIRLEAGKAYHKYQKCGIKGATNLFITGW